MAENTAYVNTQAPRPLSKALRIWYGVGDFGFTLMTNVETFFFNKFLTDVALFSNELTLTVTTIASTIDACLSWIYGGIINAVKPGKWGRYRTWLVMVPWIVPFLYAFQFMSLSGNPTTSAIIITIATVVSHIVWNLPYAANASMVSIAARTPEQRQQLASSRATWNNLSSVFFSYLGLPLATFISNLIAGHGDWPYKFAAVAFLLGIVMAVGYFVHFKVTDGYEEIETVSAGKQSKTKASVGDMLKGLFQNPHLLVLIVADLPKWIVKFVVAGSAAYYFSEATNSAGMLTTYILIANIMAVIGAYLAGFLVKKFSSRTMMIGSMFIMAVLMVVTYFSYAAPIMVFVLMCIAQCGYGICYAAAPALYADTAVYAKWKTGKDNTGWIMGLQTVPLKVAVIVRAVVINTSLIAIAYVPKLQFEDVDNAYRQGLTVPFALVPAICLLVGGLLLLFGFRLNKEKVAKYQEEINARD